MSDFFVGEILVLLLLILPLIRPFSKALKAADAVPLLPFAALIILIFAIIGQGLMFSFIPTILIVIICIITEFARFVMFLRQVPNNFYTIPSVLLRVFVLFLLAGSFFAAFYLSPEREYSVSTLINEKTNINFFLEGIEKEAALCYTPEPCAEPNQVIITVPSFPLSSDELDTSGRYLLDEGYKISELILGKKKGFKYGFKRSEIFFAVWDSLFKNPKSNKEDRELVPAIEAISSFYKGKELFLFAEGERITELCDYYNKNPNAFSGAFFVLSEDDPLPKGLKEDLYTVLYEKDLKFSEASAEFPICFLIKPKECLAAFGDLRGNDILAGILLGSSRDLGRENRLETLRTFEKWLTLRSKITIGQP